jgi:hypothetical protein
MVLVVVVVASALAPGDLADTVPEMVFGLLWLSSRALPWRERNALALVASACTALIFARAITHEYFVTPMVAWHAGQTLLGMITSPA